jgi:retinol dehydrogenase 14
LGLLALGRSGKKAGAEQQDRIVEMVHATGSRMSSRLPASEQTAVVTGASSGIGFQTGLGLARTGMRVVMVGRDRDRTEAARRFVFEGSGSDRVATALADFSSLAQVRRLADEILASNRRLDVLVNNAGLMSPKYRLSLDGFELTLAVNHLAPFLLTNLLLERLKASCHENLPE